MDQHQTYDGHRAKPAPRALAEGSIVLIWPLHALICNFSVVRITNI